MSEEREREEGVCFCLEKPRAIENLPSALTIPDDKLLTSLSERID